MQISVFAETAHPQPLSLPSVEIIANLEEWTISVIGSNFPDGNAYIFMSLYGGWQAIAITQNTVISGGGFVAEFDAVRPSSFAQLGTIFEVSVHIPDGFQQGVAYDFQWSRPTILTQSLSNGTVSTAYNQTLTATEGDNVTLTPGTSLVWHVVGGALPPGLVLNAVTGAITGTPTTIGTFNFEVRLGNSAGLTNNAETIEYTRNFSITIAPVGTTTLPPNDGGNGGGNDNNGGGDGIGTGNWAGGGRAAPSRVADMVLRPIADVARELHRLFMIGDDMGNFRPASPITRAEAATILARVHVLDFETGFNVLPAEMDVFDTFVDVNSGNWFYYYVAWAYSASLIQGDAVTDGARTFRPNDPITRQEFATILARTADSIAAGNLPFADSSAIAEWARDYVSTAYTLGWMIGDEFNNVNPTSNISRAEVATAISRMLGRIADRAGYDMADITNLHNAIDFPDVSMLAWYYPASLSATNDHYLVRNVGGAVIMKEFVATR